MKSATFILGLILSGLLSLQTCAVYGLGGIAQSLSDDPDIKTVTTASAGGILVAFLSILAMAFALGKPAISVVFYVLGGLLALMLSNDFPDLKFWGIAMLVLAVMAWFSRSKKVMPSAG